MRGGWCLGTGWRWAALLCIAFACLWEPLYALRNPRLNWDMLAYLGIITSWHGGSAQEIMTTAFADVQRYATAHGLLAEYAELVDPANSYRHAVSTDAQAFLNQFPFYRIRPLYLGLLWLLRPLTGSGTAACVFISAAAALLVNVTLGSVAVRRLGLIRGGLLTVIFALSPSLHEIAYKQTPDALASCIAVFGLLLLLRRREVAGAAVLLLCVLVRSDQVIMDVCLALALFLLRRNAASGRWLAIALLLAAIPLERVMAAMVGGFPYPVLYNVTFVTGFSPSPAELGQVAWSVGLIVSNYVAGLKMFLHNGVAWEFLLTLAALAAVLHRAGWPRHTLVPGLALLATAGLRFAIFPSSDPRLLVPTLAGLLLLVAFTDGYQRGEG